MPAAPGPEEAYESFKREIDLLESAGRTGAPRRDDQSRFFSGLPHDEFIEV